MPPEYRILPLLREINRRLYGDVSLRAIARSTQSSTFRVHRDLRRVLGETLKQYTLRLRLERAAARLLVGREEILTIALTSGFASHEVFVRAFRRRFGQAPSQYRNSRRMPLTRTQGAQHLALTSSIGPCVRFFHHPTYKSFLPRTHTTMATLSIVRKQVAPQHILYIRRRIAPSGMQKALGECFGTLFTHGAKAGLPIAGWPLCRYISTGQGLWTIDPAMPVASPASNEGEMVADTLPGGWVALGIHHGPYEDLPDTNAAIEQWIEANGYKVGGPPWEQYVTDPAEHPDPKDWRTEVYWPLEK